MTLQVGTTRNLWVTRQSGVLAPTRRNFPLDGLEVYLPLGHPELSGSPIISKDLNALSCTVTGATHVPPTHRLFDGTDDKIVISGLNFPEDKFTVSLWVYIDPDDAILDDSVLIIWDTGNYSTDGASLGWDDRGSAQPLNGCFFNMKGTSNVSTAKSPDNTFPSAAWYFITCMYDKDEGGTTEHQLYVNNVLEKSLDFSESLITATGDFTLGLRASDDGLDFSGRCGELWIYSRKITSIEDGQIYNSTKWRYL